MAAGDAKLLKGTKAKVIDTGLTLANGVLVAGTDYENDTLLWPLCDVYLWVKYSTAPSAGVIAATLWNLRGDAEGTEDFPEGSSSITPQPETKVGTFESRNPSTTVEETLVLYDVRLGTGKNRFVARNDSGQTFADTWEVYIIPHSINVAAS